MSTTELFTGEKKANKPLTCLDHRNDPGNSESETEKMPHPLSGQALVEHLPTVLDSCPACQAHCKLL